MKIVKQRQQGDCVVAAIATATDKSYSAIKKICGTTKGGLERHEIEWLLSEVADFKTRHTKLTADQWAERNPTKRAVLIIWDVSIMWTGSSHAVAAADGKIFCPTTGESCDEKVVRVYEISANLGLRNSQDRFTRSRTRGIITPCGSST